jgi:hypothetical protein
MAKRLSLRKILVAILLGPLLALLSLNYQQRLYERAESQPPVRYPVLVSCPNSPSHYAARAGFPLAFLYGTDIHAGSSPIYTPALGGGPFAVVGSFDDDDHHSCTYFDWSLFWLDSFFYSATTILISVFKPRNKFSAKSYAKRYYARRNRD